MSDLFLSAGFPINPDLIAERFQWVNYAQAWLSDNAGLKWVLSRVDEANYWSPATLDSSKTTALVAGRFAFDELEWCQAEGMPNPGGLAARLVLDRWQKGGVRAIEQLNGAGVAVIIDLARRDIHLWTDRLGFYPIFASTDNGFVVCSNADIAATALKDVGQGSKFDPLTMAEFLHTGTASHPYTYWAGINQLDAGSYYRFTFGDRPRLVEQRRYWEPAYLREPYLTDRREIVERLTQALASAVRKRTLTRFGRTAIMLSSGADSRAALFAACVPSNVTCYTFYDEPNAELSGAQALARTAGAEHITYQRDKEYYIEHADRAVAISGGMWSVDSAHYGGIVQRLHDENPGVVLTGCYADYLLKGLSYNRRHRTVFGRALPLYRFAEFSYQWYRPFCTIQSKWQDEVLARLRQRYRQVESAGDKLLSLAEYTRLSPIIREADASGRHTLRCTSGHDVFMADNDILDLVGLISPNQKLNGMSGDMKN